MIQLIGPDCLLGRIEQTQIVADVEEESSVLRGIQHDVDVAVVDVDVVSSSTKVIHKILVH